MDSSEETANTSYEYNYEYDEVCDKQNVARIGSIAVPLVFSFVVLFSLVGNILVLVFLPHSWHSQMYRLLSNLAISDLIFTAGLPFWSCQFIWSWTFGDVMCKGVSFVFSVGFYSSIVFMMLISFWHYVSSVHVFLSLPTFFRASTFLSWVISIALAVPALFQSSVVSDTDDPNRLYCMHNSNGAKLAATYQQNSLFVVAFLLIGFCNIRYVYIILCIVIFFFIGWAPYNIVMFLQSRSYYHINDFTDCNMSDNLDYALYVCTMLAFSHCCINPVLYAFTRETFWKRLREILPCTEIPADAQQPQIAELNDD
uniref:G-protein coupled receptors family 1 profile domain-containing protein n=1 Tax=Astyanax mexicanus TaxID=7994 RepID=W5LUI3_ASTMX